MTTWRFVRGRHLGAATLAMAMASILQLVLVTSPVAEAQSQSTTAAANENPLLTGSDNPRICQVYYEPLAPQLLILEGAILPMHST